MTKQEETANKPFWKGEVKREFLFTAVLTAFVVLSIWLSGFISANTFEKVISPALFACTVTAALVGAWIVLRHTDGLRFRRMWGVTLLVWGSIDSAYLLCLAFAPYNIMDMGAYKLSTLELLFGNILGWVLLLYPTAALRPGWLTWKKALWQLLPMAVLVVLDYIIKASLQTVLALYPVVLVCLLFTHVRAYKKWCEDNYSTLDRIDVQWIMRYLVMVVLVGAMYMYMCLTHSPTRGFTQLWLTIFMFVYSTEQILFRKDPWKMVRHTDKEVHIQTGNMPNAELRNKLEAWMETEKPFLNPDFQLIDLGEVLPMNRTYLSQFIHTEYGCSFYHFVSHYRIEEAKRLITEKPELKIQEISALCGFSSPTVFSRTFASVTGKTPREWAKEIHSA